MDEIENNNRRHAELAWERIVEQVRELMPASSAALSATVLLLPFAQLVPEARNAWLRACRAGGVETCLLPRFETLMSWSRALGAWTPAADDLRLERGRDLLTARSLLARAGLKDQDQVLATALLEAAWSLSVVAAAVPPGRRVRWGASLAGAIDAGMDSPLLAFEAATAKLALAWAANSSYPSDTLFQASPSLLVWIEGVQSEPLNGSLQNSIVAPMLVLALNQQNGECPPVPVLHAADDAEDEAHRAAACVLGHLAAGRAPVALVSQDRMLTRRVHAMLTQRGVGVRDETGWKLSTTRAAATLMSLLRALRWCATTDEVLDCLKNVPAFSATHVAELENACRAMRVRDWRAVAFDAQWLQPLGALRRSMRGPRTLMQWLIDTRCALQTCAGWDAMQSDAAGQAVLATLRLQEGAECEFADAPASISQGDFIAWVDQTLEGSNFLPPQPQNVQVIVLPLSQLLGRSVAAVVLPGCDETHLPVSPEPPGRWSAAQRRLLGLPSREQLAVSQRANWRHALEFSHVDLLWRNSDRGEPTAPSGFVQELLLQGTAVATSAPGSLRTIAALPEARPAPDGRALAVRRLSSSAYEDLRRCPYRFFALRQLQLKESEEIDMEPDKRDLGNWVHHLLRQFHEDLDRAPSRDPQVRAALLDRAADQSRRDLNLSDSDFLPFAAAWPNLRAGYLRWLAEHEASGAVFSRAEVWCEVALGELTLVGKIDRIDRLSGAGMLVIDYKTEAAASTAKRLKYPAEDTQLAFYAALLDENVLAGAYVNLGEDETTRSYEQTDIVALRDQLIEGIVSDLTRVAKGAPMPALGEAKTCEYCAARGLCRRDFWEVR